MSDIAISIENLSKSYLIGHNAAQVERYTALRDVLARNARALVRKTRDMLHGRAIVQGDEVEEFWALKDVSFEVKQGDRVGIIGRNGAGKSTLLKILSRITEPTKGRITIHGRVASLLEVGTGFHPELTGRENIFLNGAILGMKRKEIQRKFDEIVDFAEVVKFLDTPVKRYSSGMYVRLAFAVAAHLEPEILVVDEVLAVGDASFQKKCLGKMGEVSKEGRTVLFVSHNMAAIEQLCSTGILLDSGRLDHSGDARKILNLYLSSFSPQVKNREGVLASTKDGAIQLLSVEAVDAGGSPLNSIRCGEELRLKLLIKLSVTIKSAAISIGINNNGTRVAVLHSKISGHDFGLEPVFTSVICTVPMFALAEGLYSLDVKLISGNDGVLWAPHVSSLIIEMGDFYNTGKYPDQQWGGVIHLKQDWRLLKNTPSL